MRAAQLVLGLNGQVLSPYPFRPPRRQPGLKLSKFFLMISQFVLQ